MPRAARRKRKINLEAQNSKDEDFRDLTVLDVACGERWQGHINMDKRRLMGIPNFVWSVFCEATPFLPFASNSVDVVFTSHAIEHIPHEMFAQFCRELLRVARYKVIIRCPHRWSYGAKGGEHIRQFDAKWFHRTFRNYPVHVEPRFGNTIIPFLYRPEELIVTVWKRERTT